MQLSSAFCKKVKNLVNEDSFHYECDDSAPLSLPYSIRIFMRNRPAIKLGFALHNQYTLVIPIHEKARAVVSGNNIELQPGKGLLVLPRQIHGYTNISEKNVLWLFCGFLHKSDTFELMRNNCIDINQSILNDLLALVTDYQNLSRLRQRIPQTDLSPARLTGSSLQLSLRLRLQVILEQLLQIHITEIEQSNKQGQTANKPRTNQTSAGELLTNRASLFMFEHMNEHLELTSVAEAMHVSPGHLRNEFKRYTGCNYTEYLNCLRVNRARHYLDTTDMSLETICHQCGYGSIYSFSRAFKRSTGVPPGQYRDNRKEIL